MQANALKYNCELDRKPSIKTAAFIADSQYAYDPKGFCEFLKKKMEQEWSVKTAPKLGKKIS